MQVRKPAVSGARRVLGLVVALATVTVGLGVGAGTAAGAESGAMAVSVPKGLAKPNAGTGIGTKAAMEDPRCNTGEQYGPYGRWNSTIKGGGPPCVVPLKAGQSNGGATSRGVTADSIKLVVIAPPAAEQGTAGAVIPMNRATGATSTGPNVNHDWFTALMPFYETWGRTIDVTTLTATGTDEAAQRADALRVIALKPFAVFAGGVAGADVLESTLAKNKIVVFGTGADVESMQAQAPYRWGLNDPNAAMIGAANAVVNQLANRKAEFGGDDVKAKPRVFGLVNQDTVQVEKFLSTLSQNKVKLATNQSYSPGNASATLGDATIAAQQAPQIVAKMKAAGVTTVLVASDLAMLNAMMKQADDQDWHPEWFLTGSGYVDYAGFIKQYPSDQLEHVFGLSLLSPAPPPASADPDAATLGSAGNPLDWFWGKNQGSDVPGATVAIWQWLLPGIHMAGPNLTPKTFEQGLFSLPPNTPSPLAPRYAFGNAAGLGYPTHGVTAMDYGAVWLANLEGRTIAGTINPSPWFVNDGRKYAANEWPKAVLPWFDKSRSLSAFDTYPANAPAQVRVPCTGCPSTGAASPTPGAPDQSHYVIALPTTGPASQQGTS